MCIRDRSSGVGVETGIFEPPVKLEGKVEVYLQTVYEAYKVSMHANLKRAIVRYPSQSRIQWLLNEANGEPTDLAQNLLLVSGMEYCKEEEAVFDQIGKGNKNALKDYNQKQIQQLNDLITTTLTRKPKGSVIPLSSS